MTRPVSKRLSDWMPDLAPAMDRPRRITLFCAVYLALIAAALSIGA